MRLFLFILAAFIVISTPAFAADKYHVYKLQNGECEIDTRDHKKMKDQRGTNDCLGHYDNRTRGPELLSPETDGSRWA
jgi:hypothetical protein